MESKGQRLGGDIDSQEYCEIAADEAYNLCLSTEEAFRHLASLLGLGPEIDRVFPLEENYAEILGDGLDEDRCINPTDLSMWVIARAWQIYHEEDTKSVVVSIRKAWEEARRECGS
jgi:hypothetical protein